MLKRALNLNLYEEASWDVSSEPTNPTTLYIWKEMLLRTLNSAQNVLLGELYSSHLCFPDYKMWNFLKNNVKASSFICTKLLNDEGSLSHNSSFHLFLWILPKYLFSKPIVPAKFYGFRLFLFFHILVKVYKTKMAAPKHDMISKSSIIVLMRGSQYWTALYIYGTCVYRNVSNVWWRKPCKYFFPQMLIRV